MTNIVASIVVAIVTNSTESIYTPPAQLYGCVVYGCPTDHVKEAQDAAMAKRTKTITTIAKEITTLKFDWKGSREITSERIIWETNCVMRMEWR